MTASPILAGLSNLAALTAPDATPCKYGAILDNLDATDRAAIEDSGASDAMLAAILTRAGHPVGSSTIYRHRQGLCYCPRKAAA